MSSTRLPPGSATVHKGEPFATEIAKLRFRLTPDEENRLDDVLDDSLARYAQLTDDTAQLDDHVTTVSRFMQDKGWNTPLTEVFLNDDTQAAPAGQESDGNRLARFRRPARVHLAR